MFNFCHNFHASDKCDSNDNNKRPPPPRPLLQSPGSHGPTLAPACGGTVNIQCCVWHQVWPREETLSCCRVPSPAQSPILTTSASWTWSWSGFPPRPFFHWISGSKPQLNQVYGNNQILIYPKVFNPYWWFLFALFVQKCKWALNKGKGEGEGGRCHIIGVTSIQIFWSAFLITMIRVWHLSMYWLLIEEKYFRNEMKVVLNVKSSNIFLLAILKKRSINFYCWLLQHELNLTISRRQHHVLKYADSTLF